MDPTSTRFSALLRAYGLALKNRLDKKHVMHVPIQKS